MSGQSQHETACDGAAICTSPCICALAVSRDLGCSSTNSIQPITKYIASGCSACYHAGAKCWYPLDRAQNHLSTVDCREIYVDLCKRGFAETKKGHRQTLRKSMRPLRSSLETTAPRRDPRYSAVEQMGNHFTDRYLGIARSESQ